VRLSAAEVAEIRAIGDNTGSMLLKGATPDHEGGDLPDRWAVAEELAAVGERWGIDPGATCAAVPRPRSPRSSSTPSSSSSSGSSGSSSSGPSSSEAGTAPEMPAEWRLSKRSIASSRDVSSTGTSSATSTHSASSEAASWKRSGSSAAESSTTRSISVVGLK
jgi:hypothetical protein